MLDNEKDIIRRAKKGEPALFGDLYDHYLPQIYRYVFLKVGNKQETEDLTHEVFLSAWQNLKDYRSQGFPFSTWLYQIAHNRVIDYYRTRKSHSSLDEIDENFVKLASTVEKDLDLAIDLAKVRSAIHKLKDDQQDVIVMRFVEEMSHREIAEVMGRSEGAVRLIQHRALTFLKEMLEQKNNEA